MADLVPRLPPWYPHPRMVDPRLGERPDARPMRVEDLLRHATAGRIRVPRFQRPLKWKPEHVLGFFDSLYRGFPIGSLLLWRRSQPAQSLAFGPVGVEAPAQPDALVVVDGQQRVTSLVGALCHPGPEPRAGLFAVWFDLEVEKFVRLTRGAPPPTWIPLNVVIDSVALLEWVDAWPYRNERPDLKRTAFELGKRIREYELPSYVVATEDERTVRLIFQRVNTSGIRLEEREVFEALHGRPEDERPLTSTGERLRALGFGRPHEKDLLLCLKTVGGLDPREEARDLEATATGPLLHRTEAALLRVFNFLSEDAGVPHLRLLPYAPPLAALARFFDLHPRPLSRSRVLLARWLWRGALSGEHSKASTFPTVREWVRGIDRDEEGSVQRLLGQIHGSPIDYDPMRKWNAKDARTRLFALFLLAQRPRDPMFGTPVPIDTVRRALDDGADLQRVFVPAEPTGHVPIAGRFVLPGGHPARLWACDAECQASHVLTTDAVNAAVRGDLAELYRLRAAEMQARSAVFFKARTGLDYSDRPTLPKLLRESDRRLTG